MTDDRQRTTDDGFGRPAPSDDGRQTPASAGAGLDEGFRSPPPSDDGQQMTDDGFRRPAPSDHPSSAPRPPSSDFRPPPSDDPSSALRLLSSVRRAARQEQFLEVVPAEEARRRFEGAIDRSPLPAETVALAGALGRVLAADVAAPTDVPAFDRSGVDGFAVRAADTAGAGERSPRRLVLNAEVIACGHPPALEVQAGTATAIATGGAIPRGADAVVMIEHTSLVETAGGPGPTGAAGAAIDVARTAGAGQFVSFAGSDIARGETVLRRGSRIGSREIGMLAACGIAEVAVVRRPRVAVLSTGDELVPPGEPLRPAAVYDSNGAIVAAAVAEAGGEAVPFGAFPDDEATLEAAVRQALAACDMVVLSGGTSKGAGDLSTRILSRFGPPGVLVHGVALKPGKPLCLAAVGEKPVAVLPGFPTSAIFTFHAFVAPVIRALGGLPPEAAKTVTATLPVRIASELGREEFVLVALVPGGPGGPGEHRPVAFPIGKGSGAVTAFSQADGFLSIDALSTGADAGGTHEITLIGTAARMPDIVIMGSHCVALDLVLGRLAELGFSARSLAIGSMGGVVAAGRGECDIAPVHLLDPASGLYNRHLVRPGISLVPGWRRMQGFVFRPDDPRFCVPGITAREALRTALAEASCRMVNRNAGAGTRILIDQLLEGGAGARRPPGYANQPKSHNAVAVAVAQGRADWGIAIAIVARLYGLGFLAIAPEHYDFLVLDTRRARPAVQAFLTALEEPGVRETIARLGMGFADGNEADRAGIA
jgi:putative molybdopterin biosynthesis protein